MANAAVSARDACGTLARTVLPSIAIITRSPKVLRVLSPERILDSTVKWLGLCVRKVHISLMQTEKQRTKMFFSAEQGGGEIREIIRRRKPASTATRRLP